MGGWPRSRDLFPTQLRVPPVARFRGPGLIYDEGRVTMTLSIVCATTMCFSAGGHQGPGVSESTKSGSRGPGAEVSTTTEDGSPMSLALGAWETTNLNPAN